jgi:hypothetical protein
MTVELTAREINGVFRIRYNNTVGTAFILHSEKGAVFVTAGHVLSGLVAGENVLFQRDSDWFPATVSEFVPSREGDDLCVFISSSIVLDKLLPPYLNYGIRLGDPVKFLGFPHGLQNTYPGKGFPTPLVRHAHFSGVVRLGGRDVVLLDGFNNPGYSGSPVYTSGKDGKPTFFGVVSGYRYELESHGAIYQKEPDGTEKSLPNLYVKPNSGMIYAVSSGRVDEMLALVRSYIPIQDSAADV